MKGTSPSSKDEKVCLKETLTALGSLVDRSQLDFVEFQTGHQLY
jgi:hypothetical protein